MEAIHCPHVEHHLAACQQVLRHIVALVQAVEQSLFLDGGLSVEESLCQYSDVLFAIHRLSVLSICLLRPFVRD